MNVLIVTNQFPSKEYIYKGSFIFEQVKEIVKHCTNVYVLAPNYGDDKKKEVKERIEIYRFKTYTKKTLDPLLRNLFSGVRGFFALIMFVLIQTFSIYKLALKHKIDLIHAHWILPSGFSSLIVAKLLGKKMILTIHGSDVSYCKNKNVLKFFLKFILKRADLLIGISDDITREILEFRVKEDKVRRIYLGINKNTIPSEKSGGNQQPSSKKKIVMVGSLYPIKGIPYLQEIVKVLSKKREDFEFHIIGDGELMHSLKEFIQTNNLEQYCIIHGFLPHKATLEIIKDSDICIQTSLSEGLSVVVQEAICMGKPIIATDVGGTKEIVIDNYNGFIISTQNVVQAVEKLDYLLSSSNLIEKMGKNSLKIAKEKLDLEKNVKQIIHEYRRCLNIK
ncbi:MAG: glycosyltransferase [Candidatus Heimdallarchaeaceae archaeon]